jgi:hypothetical protein
LSYRAFLLSVALFVLAIAALPVLHGGWDAVAGGLMLMSAVTAPLAFALAQNGPGRRPAEIRLRGGS